MKKTIKFENSVRITLLIGAISTTSLSADTYYYHQSDGSILLTDKKVNKKGYILKKTYRSKSKSKSLKHKTIFVKKNNKKHSPNKRKSCKQLSANVIRQKTHPYLPQIQKYALQYQVEENLIRAIMRQESCFKAKAKSPVGAMGLMQLMPGTAKDLGVINAWNPEQNIRGGVKYISQQYNVLKVINA
jgi:SLT domain-containing protein